jgi:hypothetical protein
MLHSDDSVQHDTGKDSRQLPGYVAKFHAVSAEAGSFRGSRQFPGKFR